MRAQKTVIHYFPHGSEEPSNLETQGKRNIVETSTHEIHLFGGISTMYIHRERYIICIYNCVTLDPDCKKFQPVVSLIDDGLVTNSALLL